MNLSPLTDVSTSTYTPLLCTNIQKDNWVSVPTNSVVTIHKQTVLLHPIIDEFYGEDFNHDRSSCYAVSKGLVSTAPGTTVAPQSAEGSCASPETAAAAAAAAAEPRTINGMPLDHASRPGSGAGLGLDEVGRGLSHLNLGSQNGVFV